MRSDAQVAMNSGLDPMIVEMRERVARRVNEKLSPRAAETDESEIRRLPIGREIFERTG